MIMTARIAPLWRGVFTQRLKGGEAVNDVGKRWAVGFHKRRDRRREDGLVHGVNWPQALVVHGETGPATRWT